jgi:hypothetical protein
MPELTEADLDLLLMDERPEIPRVETLTLKIAAAPCLDMALAGVSNLPQDDIDFLRRAMKLYGDLRANEATVRKWSWRWRRRDAPAPAGGTIPPPPLQS